ncbi:MAG: glycosyltransferase [Candidatus Nealsonbacteria bacterium]
MEETTILVAVLNKNETIRACVESLLNLKEAPAKIMIVDGYSTDGTYEILKEYQDKIELHQYPQNLSATFNWALDRIGTKYAALTDGDCVVSPDWLTELLKGFAEENIVAAAGYCSTPKGLSLFQKIIGLELENRFRRFPKYLSRAPTMNLCLKTDLAKKIKFDEKQMVDVEADFGFRLTKLGKIVYMPKAEIFHHHRNTLKNYFKQQKDYAKWGLRLLLKHGPRAAADSITTLSMSLQIPFFTLGLISLFLSFFNWLFIYPTIFFAILLFIIYIKNIIEIKPPLACAPILLIVFVLRTMSWLTGIAEGILFSFSEVTKK